MKERFKKICSVLEFSQKELAERLSIDVRKLRCYVYETKNFPIEFLTALNKELNININWLITGEGSMFVNSKGSTLKFRNISLPIVLNISKGLCEIQSTNCLSDKDMAKLLGIYEYDYIDLKNGVKEPDIKILNRIKQSFDVSIDLLLYG